MMNSVVSVIVTVYNNRDYVEKCIRSIINQTYKNIELVIINDGSKDDSEIIIEKYLADNIIYIKQENQGVCVARNNAMKKATGKYILFIDGDDYVDEDYVENLVVVAEKDNADLTICGYKMIKPNDEVISIIKPENYDINVNESWAYRICAVCGRLYKRELWEQYDMRFIDEKGARGEDSVLCFFWNSVLKRISISPTAGYNYVQHEGSAMNEYYGFQKYHFPYKTFEDIMDKITQITDINEYKYLEYGVIKFFAQFILVLSKGATKEKIDELCEYIKRMMKKFFLSSQKDLKELFKEDKNIPLSHKLAINVFFFLLRKKDFAKSVYNIVSIRKRFGI